MAIPDRVRTALLLAAGTGSRLSPLTDTTHKCLTEVNGTPILKQQVACLDQLGFEHLIVVVGKHGDEIRRFLDRSRSDVRISYVHNPLYQTTNNIYSLWLAQKAITEPFLLLECDLFFEVGLLTGMLRPDTIALATREPWMGGTTVTLSASRRVTAFQLDGGGTRDPVAYKTVNIHSLSLATWHRVGRRLDKYVSSGRVNDFYEAVFRDMAAEGVFNPRAVSFDTGKWYEIDTLDDLRAAEQLFAGIGAPPVAPIGAVAGSSVKAMHG